MDAPADEIADAVHIIHQPEKVLILRVVASGVKVGRTVGVRKRLGSKRMGDIPVYPPHQHKIGEPFHLPKAFAPAIGAEIFTHCPSFFLGIDMGKGGTKFSQTIIEELIVRLKIPGSPGVGTAFDAGNHLVQHNIHPGHILSPQGTEIMTGSVAQTTMAVVLLNDVANILHPMRPAPVPDLFAEVLPVEGGHGVHVGVPYPPGILPDVVPKTRKNRCHIFSKAFLKQLLQLFAPGHRHIWHPADGRMIAIGIAHLGFIGEKSFEGFSKVIFIVSIVSLIDGIDQYLGPFGSQRVKIFVQAGRMTADTGKGHIKDTPIPLGNLPIQLIIGDVAGQIYEIAIHIIFFSGAAAGNHPIEDIFLRNLQKKRGTAGGSDHIDMGFFEKPFAVLRVIPHHPSCRIAGWEQRIIQHPNLHAPLAAFIHNDIHIPPPKLSHKIGMGTGFHTQRPNMGLMDFGNHLPKQRFVLPMLPEKRKNMVIPRSVKQGTDGCLHLKRLLF